MTSLHRQTAWSGRISRYGCTLKSDQQPALNNQFWTSTDSEHQLILNINQFWTTNSELCSQGLSAEEQERQREEWKAELRFVAWRIFKWSFLWVFWYSDMIFWYLLHWDICSSDEFRKNYPDRKTEEEILTLRQVLTAKERHAAGKTDNLTHTNLKILHLNDKHDISVKRFCKTWNFQVWSADWVSPSGGSSARTWPRAWRTCRRAPHTRERRKIFNLQRFFSTISRKTPLSKHLNWEIW